MTDATRTQGPPKRGLKSRVIAAVAFAVFVLAFGYLGTQYQSPTLQASVEKLSIAVPSAPQAALLHIAAAKGYFAEEGLDVTILPTIHGKAAIELVVEGKADLGTAAEVVFVLSAAKAGGLGIAANMFTSSDDLAVIARRDSGIAAPRDIAGKKIGVTLGTAGEFFLWAFLIRQELEPDSVVLIDLPPGQIAPAIAAGTIDAAATWQPFVRAAQLALKDNARTFHEPLAYTETFNVIGRNDFLKGHSKAIEKLVRAMLKAEEFSSAQPEQALSLLADLLKVDGQALQPLWKDSVFRVDLRQSQLMTLENETRWAMARGHAATGQVPNFLPHLYVDALLAVRPDRVTVVR